jgi:hypothetical protein
MIVRKLRIFAEATYRLWVGKTGRLTPLIAIQGRPDLGRIWLFHLEELVLFLELIEKSFMPISWETPFLLWDIGYCRNAS